MFYYAGVPKMWTAQAIERMSPKPSIDVSGLAARHLGQREDPHKLKARDGQIKSVHTFLQDEFN